MSKNKKSKKQISILSRRGILALFMVFVFSFSIIGFSIVQADKFDSKIKQLQEVNNKKENVYDQLGSEASSLSQAVAKLQDEINSKQAAINRHQAEVAKLKIEIKAAEIELKKQKDLLSETIRAIYLEGDVSTIEMLASSDDLADYFDKEQYRESVRTKVKSTLDTVNQLKLDLGTKKQKTEDLIKEQETLKGELLGQRNEQNQLLSLNNSQRNVIDQSIKNNNKKISKLRQQQAIENAKHFKGVNVVSSGSCGGTYPAKALNNYGAAWGCNYAQDNTVDNWGMYNRECVSYTAWRVASSGRNMPYWGGRGNANKWDDNARAAGIPVSSTPKAGDIAIAHWGAYGHSMYVESVNSNGTINISQYNWDYNGTYSKAYNFSASGLVFIHFR